MAPSTSARADWLLIGALGVAVFAAGCAAVVPLGAPTAICPEPKAWAPDEEKRAAAELEGLAPGSVLAGMIVDYVRMRDELKACRT